MKHVEIYNALLAELSAAHAQSRLEGEPALARRFGVARETVRKALDRLQREGLIERHCGAGTFVTERGTRKTGVIGLLMPDYEAAGFFARLRGDMDTIAAKIGYSTTLETISAPSAADVADAVRRAARRLVISRVEGVVFRPLLDARFARSNREVVRIFRRADTPVVLLDSDIAAPPDRSDIDLVTVNNVSAGRRIAEHLLASGRSRIAFLMAGPTMRSNANWQDRLFGIAGELAVSGLASGVAALRFQPDNAPRLRALMRSKARPDAIVCGNDEAAARLVATLQAIGKRVPHDCAVVGFDDGSAARESVPPLTTIRQPTRLLAKTALKTLFTRIRNNSAEIREIHLDAPLIVRQST